MSITITNSAAEPRAFSLGPLKAQLLEYVANSGATSGTVTADTLSRIEHIMLLGGRLVHSAAPTFSGNAATLAFVVPAETAASLVVQDITYTAVANLGAGGNSVTIEYTDGTGDGVVNGAEVVTVTGNAISVAIEDGVSTATHVKAAIDASAAAIALVSAAITGTGSNAQAVATATPLAGGVTGGARGSLLCLGR